MFVVVGGEEGFHEGAGLMDVREGVGEVGNVFEGFELGFGERVVVGDAGSGVGSGDVQIDEELSDGFGGHRGSAVGVEGVWGSGGPLDRGVDEIAGEVHVFAVGEDPAGVIAGEDVDDDVEVVPASAGASDLGDVPCLMPTSA